MLDPFPPAAGTPTELLRVKIVVVLGVKQVAERDLLLVREAARGLRLGLSPSQRGQKHARENRNDRDHNQELDERESSSVRLARPSH